MIEITVKRNAAKVLVRKNGDLVRFEKGKLKYLADDDEIAKRILELPDSIRVADWEVNTDISAFRVYSDWKKQPPKALRDILEALGVEVKDFKSQAQYITAIEKCIDRGIVVVEEAPITLQGGMSDENIERRFHEYDQEIKALHDRLEKQKTAFELALAEVLAGKTNQAAEVKVPVEPKVATREPSAAVKSRKA